MAKKPIKKNAGRRTVDVLSALVGTLVSHWKVTLGVTVFVGGGTVLTLKVSGKPSVTDDARHVPTQVGQERTGAGGGDALMSVRPAAMDVSLLPPDFRGDGSVESAVLALREASGTLADAESSVECCAALLDMAIAQGHAVVNTLQRGERLTYAGRSRVRSVQVCLASIGRYKGRMDGDPAMVAQAVMQYQRDRGLRPDGIVGGKTWTRLKSEVLRSLNVGEDAAVNAEAVGLAGRTSRP